MLTVVCLTQLHNTSANRMELGEIRGVRVLNNRKSLLYNNVTSTVTAAVTGPVYRDGTLPNCQKINIAEILPKRNTVIVSREVIVSQ